MFDVSLLINKAGRSIKRAVFNTFDDFAEGMIQSRSGVAYHSANMITFSLESNSLGYTEAEGNSSSCESQELSSDNAGEKQIGGIV